MDAELSRLLKEEGCTSKDVTDALCKIGVVSVKMLASVDETTLRDAGLRLGDRNKVLVVKKKCAPGGQGIAIKSPRRAMRVEPSTAFGMSLAVFDDEDEPRSPSSASSKNNVPSVLEQGSRASKKKTEERSSPSSKMQQEASKSTKTLEKETVSSPIQAKPAEDVGATKLSRPQLPLDGPRRGAAARVQVLQQHLLLSSFALLSSSSLLSCFSVLLVFSPGVVAHVCARSEAGAARAAGLAARGRAEQRRTLGARAAAKRPLFRRPLQHA